MAAFNAARLRLARMRRGLTKEELATRAGLTRRSITEFEFGSAPPCATTLSRLAGALEFPVEFFTSASPDFIRTDSASFRSLSTMTAAQRNSVLAAGSLALELAGWINERFNLPPPNVPDLRGMSPEVAAVALRARWMVGSEKPIPNMVHLLEAHGIRVFSLAEDCIEIDGFSLWHRDIPYVFLNTLKSAERGRMDAAHELGHLVLHRHGPPRGQETEREANQFASAFLMPQAAIISSAPRIPSVPRLLELKQRWKVSIAAATYRLHELGLMTDWQYRDVMVEISKRGWRKTEPEGLPRETSQILDKVLRSLYEDGVGRADIARSLHITVRELEALVFGLVVSPLGNKPSEWTSKPLGAGTPDERRLRLLK